MVHEDWGAAVAFSPNGRLLAIGSGAGKGAPERSYYLVPVGARARQTRYTAGRQSGDSLVGGAQHDDLRHF